ncbi:MAG: aldo/keto reductase [Chloroflexi bacterium]|nr:aldo/keto reductase [Chloroflexota bacterium]
MQSRMLGRNGPQVPVIGFGAWPIGGGMGAVDDREAIRTLHHAVDVGVTLIDTAEAYRRSEEIIGQALAEWSGPRDRLFIATKVRGDDLSADHIVTAVERSLQALRIDVIDLLQAHSWDAHHPIEETMTAFDRLVAAGKVRYLGVSNFDADQMEAAWRIRPFQSDQPRYNLLDREAGQGVLPYCASHGIAVLAHSPLAKGLLTGKYRSEPSFPPDDERGQMARFSGAQFQQVLTRTRALEEWARAHGHSLVELAIAWVLANPAVTVCLCGAKNARQVDDHVRAADWSLTRADLDEIDGLLARA